MHHRKIQYLSTALLASSLLVPALPARSEDETPPSPQVTASPTSTPRPSPTPRIIPIAVYFRRAAQVIPVYREAGKTVIDHQDFEVVDEVPWLTEADVIWVEYWPQDDPQFIRLVLTPEGVVKFAEAEFGNAGRQVVLVVDGTVRAVTPLEKIDTRRHNRIEFAWAYSSRELQQLQAQISIRPSPSPTPPPSPTPGNQKRFIIGR